MKDFSKEAFLYLKYCSAIENVRETFMDMVGKRVGKRGTIKIKRWEEGDDWYYVKLNNNLFFYTAPR